MVFLHRFYSHNHFVCIIAFSCALTKGSPAVNNVEPTYQQNCFSMFLHQIKRALSQCDFRSQPPISLISTPKMRTSTRYFCVHIPGVESDRNACK
ncbi:hypothetical protein C8F04DRAFT_1102629 [Mycena alexandri]|uniref:Secreted protein n=1 Tax=Mycena alexandri TaxID=1745969 RepID=A0AAD6SYR9_9AGAR|nr:hypothetical protein C8F04DRAFT_1102629 [Mycena alexandri]